MSSSLFQETLDRFHSKILIWWVYSTNSVRSAHFDAQYAIAIGGGRRTWRSRYARKIHNKFKRSLNTRGKYEKVTFSKKLRLRGFFFLFFCLYSRVSKRWSRMSMKGWLASLLFSPLRTHIHTHIHSFSLSLSIFFLNASRKRAKA